MPDRGSVAAPSLRRCELVLRLGLEVARVVALAQLARPDRPQTRLTMRPRFTAGRSAIASVQRWTCL